jgi:enoyl-CoA hydratase/carnithine racemase
VPEATGGLCAAAGGLFRHPKRIPLALATEVAITGDPIDATRAFQLGLVNRLVPADQVVDAAVDLADRIARNGPLAVKNSLQMVREAGDLSDEDAWRRNYELAMEVFASKDSIEGATAFAEKREPRWTGT